MNFSDEINSSSIIKYTTGELIDIQIALTQRVFAENDPLTHYKNAVKEKAHTYIRKHTQPPSTSPSSSASSRSQRPGKEIRSTKNFDFEAFKRQEDQKHTGERFSSPTKDSKAAALSTNTTLDFFGLDKISDDKFISLDDIDDFSKLRMADTDDIPSFNNLTSENDKAPQQLPPPPPPSSNDVDDGFDDDFGPNVDIDSAFADKPESEGNDAIQRMLFQSGDFGIGGGGIDGHPIPPPMPVSSITDYNNPTSDVTPNQGDVVNNTAFSNDLFSKIQMASIEQQHLNNEKVNQQQNNFNNIFAQNNNGPFVQNNNSSNFVQNAVTANDSFVQNNQYGSIPIQNIFGNNNQISAQPTMVQMQPFGSFTQVYPGMINQVKAQPSQPFNLLAPQPQYISPSKQQSLMLMQKQQMLALQQRKMQLKNHQKQHQQQHAGLSTDEGSRTLRKLYGLEDGDTTANNVHHKGNNGGYNQQMMLKQQQQQQFHLQKQQQQQQHLSAMQKQQQQQQQLSMMQKQQLQHLQKQQQQLLMLQKQQHQQIKIERVAGIRQNGMNAAQKMPQKQSSYHSSEQFPPLK